MVELFRIIVKHGRVEWNDCYVEQNGVEEHVCLIERDSLVKHGGRVE